MKSKYAICFVTAELAPLAKAGGLADVAGALTSMLHRDGHEVLTFLPLYAGISRAGLSIEPVDGLGGLSATLGTHRYRYSILRGRRRGGLPDVMLVDCPSLFNRPGLYGDGPDEHRRFLVLCRAALEGCRRLGFAPDIVHCHDWHTAVLPLWLRSVCASESLFARTRSVLTIHNLGYQGVIPADCAPDLALGRATDLLDSLDLVQGRINLLRHGLRDADVVSTVSPTYAREICTPEHGMGLDGVLNARGDEIEGILNGVDYTIWSPEHDIHLPHPYSAADLAGKARMREALCARLGLEPGPDCLLVGMVTRLAWQKGVDLLFDVLPQKLASGRVAIVALGSGDSEYERFFEGLARLRPTLAAFSQGYDDDLAHWIEAGADAFLMPSRYEPCGLNQLYSLRYGTVPIVRRTGGLADSVQHFDPASGTGTGVVFNDADSAAVNWALDTAVAWHGDTAAWARLVDNGMRQDFSWDRQFSRYVDLYATAAARPRRGPGAAG